MKIYYGIFGFFSLLVSGLAAECTTGYDIGGCAPICWKTNTNTTAKVQLPLCPPGMNIEFTVPLPDLMRAQEIYNVEYAFTVKKVMLLLLFLLPSFLCLSITHYTTC
jgi:hypothetical protein